MFGGGGGGAGASYVKLARRIMSSGGASGRYDTMALRAIEARTDWEAVMSTTMLAGTSTPSTAVSVPMLGKTAGAFLCGGCGHWRHQFTAWQYVARTGTWTPDDEAICEPCEAAQVAQWEARRADLLARRNEILFTGTDPVWRESNPVDAETAGLVWFGDVVGQPTRRGWVSPHGLVACGNWHEEIRTPDGQEGYEHFDTGWVRVYAVAAYRDGVEFGIEHRDELTPEQVAALVRLTELSEATYAIVDSGDWRNTQTVRAAELATVLS